MTARAYIIEWGGIYAHVKATTRARARAICARSIADAGYVRRPGAVLIDLKPLRAPEYDAAPTIGGKPEGLVPNTWRPERQP